MADATCYSLATTSRDYFSTSGDAPFRYIGNEARDWIAVHHRLLVLGHLNDAVSNRLRTAFGMYETLIAGSDVGLRNGVSLNNSDPRRRLNSGEVFRSLSDFSVGDHLQPLHHGVAVLAVTALPIGHGLDEITHRQPGHISRFIMTGAGGQMA